MTVPNPVITLNNVTVGYGRRTALQGVSGSFEAGSLTAVAGPNGAGKSTLLKIMAGILTPKEGQVSLCPTCAQRLAYLPQTAAIRRDFPVTVVECVCAGFWPQTGGAKGITQAMRQRAREALAEVGLEGFESRLIEELSGGQFQRMLFARLMVQDARIILLDEPFAGIDAPTTAKLIGVILDWHKQGRTIVCVLHDLLMIRKYFPESFVLAGKCLGSGHTHALFDQKLLSFDLDMAELLGPGETPVAHDHGHDDV